MNTTITELYVDPNAFAARAQWSLGSAPHGQEVTLPIPSQLQTGNTYLLLSEVNFQYVPTIGYVMAKTGVNLSDVAYTRPRQSLCVMYNTTVFTTY